MHGDIQSYHASAGYDGLPPSGRYNKINYQSKVIRRMLPKALAPRLFEINNNIDACGSTIARRHEVCGAVQPYEDDGFNKPMEVTYPDEEYMDIEYAWACHRKYSPRVHACLMAGTENIIEEQMMADEKQGSMVLDSLAISTWITSAHKRNRGNHAGVECGQYNVGSFAVPVPVTSSSVEDVISDFECTINEWNNDINETPVLVLPKWMKKKIRANERLTSYMHTGNCVGCPLVTGAFEHKIFGFDVIFHSCLKPMALDEEGERKVWPVLFGYRSHGEIMINFEKRRLSDTVPGDRSIHYEKWWDVGIHSFDPRLIGVGAIECVNDEEG